MRRKPFVHNYLLRALLFTYGLVSCIGGVWFISSPSAHFGVITGTAMIAWALLWNRKESLRLIAALGLVSLVGTIWGLITGFDLQDLEPTAIRGVGVAVACVCTVIWVRRNIA